jgi:hypothetical protein
VSRVAASLVALLAALTLARAAYASEDETCSAPVRAWAASCTAAGEGRVQPFRCPPGHAVFSVAIADRPPVFVDASAQGQGLRQIGAIGLSPLGEFADFEQAPVAVREAFARVEGCLERDPGLTLDEDGGRAPEGAARAREHPRNPVLFVVALVLAAIAVSARRRPRPRTLRTAALLLGLGGLTLALAYGVAGPSFFHQNGHGPNWIGYALGQPCPYGPGYQELFGWLARLRPSNPEPLVFACNATLAACCPPAAWLVARRTGANALLAWAIALAAALDPLLWRMAPSESYYVPCTLLPLAAAAIALGVPTLRAWSVRSLLAVAAATLLLAQAARVHPVAWVAVAVFPLVFLARRGAVRRTLVHAGIALAMVGVVVALACGPALLGVLSGEMGERYRQWRGGSGVELKTAAVVAVAVACVLLPWLRGRAIPRVAALAVVAGASTLGTSLLAVDVDWLRSAHWHPFAAAFVAAGVGVAGRFARTPGRLGVAAGLVVAAALLNVAMHARWATELPTDALELRLALGWRPQLREDARLVAVSTAGVMSLDLPVYERDTGVGGTPLVRLDVTGAPPGLTSFGDDVLYYRSSLCSTAAARAWCDGLESTAVLTPLSVDELPARPSTHATAYDAPRIRVGLYRVSPRP